MRIDEDSNQRSQEHDARFDYEIKEPELARNAFDACASKLGFLPSSLAETIKELKAESAPIELHYLSDGEEIDLDDYLDAASSGEKTMDVYRDEIVGREITDLAVSLLVDCSGSMRGRESYFAYATSVLVSLACEEADVPYEIAAFSTGGVLYVKRFDEDRETTRELLGTVYSAAQTYYGSIIRETVNLWGGTDLEGALPIMLENLRKDERKKAKLLFIITDGLVNNPERIGRMVADAREKGIVVVGVGVGVASESLKACFSHCRSFDGNSIGKLPEYIAEEIEEAISSQNFLGY